MPIMAITTIGRVQLAIRQSYAVHAQAVAFGLFLVADPAIDRLGRQVIVRMLERNITVATRAAVRAVDRCRKLRQVHKAGNLFPCGIGSSQRLFRMTFHASAVLDLLSD